MVFKQNCIVKTKYHNKERDLNAEVERLNELLQQQDVQYHSVKAVEIEQLNQSIQKLQSEKNELLVQMQQKQHEIHNLQNMLTETKNTAEKNHARLIKEKEDEADEKQQRLIKETEDYANKEHNRLMNEKNKEMQNIIQKYQGLETRFNQMEQNHLHQMSQYKKDVSAEALRLAGQITKEKDEEIQQLTEELTRHQYKPGESLGQLGGMIQSLGNITEGEMEEEVPKQYPRTVLTSKKKRACDANKIQRTCKFWGEDSTGSF